MKISRVRQADEWALRSHQRAVSAIDRGLFRGRNRSDPHTHSGKGDPLIFDADETPRRDTTLERLSKLRAVYPDGVCTAGNSSSENDGASAVVLMSETRAKDLGIAPLAYFRSCAVAGTDPTLTYPAVPAATQKALDKVGLTIADVDLIEIQEAFAVQALADAKLMGIAEKDFDRKNQCERVRDISGPSHCGHRDHAIDHAAP